MTLEWGTERQAQVAELVRQQGHAKVDDLAQRFGVSPQTIRKDINEMCERGLLRRVHGGVELAGVKTAHYELRRILNIGAKRQIGQAAAEIIPDDVTLAMSIGTTPELVASHLARHQGLRIFTNNLSVAMTAHQFDGVEITIPGGRLRRSEADIVGPKAVDFFAGYRFDIGLFGVGGVDADGGLLDLSEEDMQSRQAIADASEMRVLVLDGSKFGRKAHVRGGAITDVEVVICDTRPPAALVAQLQAAHVRLIICGEGAA